MVFYDLCFNKYMSHNKKNVIDIKIIPIIVCVYIKEISSSKKKRNYPRNWIISLKENIQEIIQTNAPAWPKPAMGFFDTIMR